MRAGVVVSGFCLGFILSHAGFTSFDEVHKLFTLSDLRLMGVFAVAVVVVVVGLRVLPAGKALPKKEFHKGLVPGALLFGLGWALSGGCPGAVLAMVGEGQAAAVVVLVSVLAGSALHDAFARHVWRQT